MKKLYFLSLFLVATVIVSFRHRPMTWVAIGDSITYLNDHTDETGRRVTKGYLSRVIEKLSYVRYINQGHNGWTSRRIADSIGNLAIPRADIYTIFLGTNDWWHGDHIGRWEDYAGATGDTTIYGSFRIITDKIRSLNPDASIVLITPLQRSDFVYIDNMKNNAYGSYKDKAGQSLEQVVSALKDIGQHEHFKIVDLYHNKKLSIPYLVHYKRLRSPQTGEYKNYTYPDYIDVPFDPVKDEYPYPLDAIGMTYDGLHPSDNGNEEIAKKLVDVMKKLR
jgi:lysophospholipase L1-like esterase